MQILSEQFIQIRPVVIKRLLKIYSYRFLFFDVSLATSCSTEVSSETHQVVSQNLLIDKKWLFKNCIFEFRKFWTEYLGSIYKTCFLLFASRMKSPYLDFHCLLFYEVCLQLTKILSLTKLHRLKMYCIICIIVLYLKEDCI